MVWFQSIWELRCLGHSFLFLGQNTPRKHPSCVLRCAESQPVTILPTSATARCQHLCEMITVLGKASNGGEISGKNRLKNPIEAYFLLFSQIDAQTLQNCANKKCPRSSFCTTAPQKSRAPNRLGSLRSPQSKASPGCTKPRQHVFLRVIHSWHLAVAKYEELKNTQTNRFLEHPLHNIYRKIWISKYFINHILMVYTIHGKCGNGLLLPPGCRWDFSCWVATGHVGGVARPCEM